MGDKSHALIGAFLAFLACARPALAEPAVVSTSTGSATFRQLLPQIEEAYKARDYARGLSLVQRVLELPQTNVANLDRIGTVYYVLGRYGDALTMWRKALPLERDVKKRRELENSITATSLSLGLGQTGQAAQMLPAHKAPEIKPDPEESERLYKRGIKFYAEGEYLQARAMFLRSLQLFPGNSDAQKALQRLSLESGAAETK